MKDIFFASFYNEDLEKGLKIAQKIFRKFDVTIGKDAKVKLGNTYGQFLMGKINDDEVTHVLIEIDESVRCRKFRSMICNYIYKIKNVKGLEYICL